MEEKKKVLTVVPLQPHHKEILEQISPELEFCYEENETVTPQQVQEANIIFGNVNPDYLKGAHHLELLQLNSAGADQYVGDGVMPEGAKLANATGAYGLAVGEHMLAMIYTMMKKINLYCKHMEEHNWTDEGTVGSFYGANVLVVGLGDIGSEFAKRAHALGSRVYGVRRNKTEKPDYLEELCTMDELDRLLPMADVVACSLPGNKETYHLFHKERLAKMKKTAILANVGRGSLIPTQDLCEALTEGLIGGVCMDVAETEPLPADSPLWDLPNLILTPHISGFYHLPETLERIVKIAGENIQAVCQGRPVKNEVDFETGYRKFERK